MKQIIATLVVLLGGMVLIATAAPKDDAQFPAITSMSIAKDLPDGSELGVIEIAGRSYFVVFDKAGNQDALPEIVERIDCNKADKDGYFYGKSPEREASCKDPNGKDRDPVLVFHGGQ